MTPKTSKNMSTTAHRKGMSRIGPQIRGHANGPGQGPGPWSPLCAGQSSSDVMTCLMRV